MYVSNEKYYSTNFNTNSLYILTILELLNEFVFCLTDLNDKNNLAFAKTNNKVLIDEDFILKNFQITVDKIKKVKVFSSAANFALYPPFFMEQNHISKKENTTHIILSNGVQLHFSNNKLDTKLYNLFPFATSSHYFQVLINMAFNNVLKNYIVANYINTTLYLIIIKNGVLHFANVFDTNYTNDAIYYILLSIEKFECSKEDFSIEVFANAEDKVNIESSITNYLTVVKQTSLNSIIDSSLPLDKINAFVPLVYAMQCE